MNYLFNTFLTALITSSELGNHSFNNTGEYGAGVSAVVFDRGGYLYHGRVKSVADGAREGGLQF